MDKPKKWHEVYPYGTKAGNEEALVFRALSRNAKFTWRSTGAIVKETSLTRERVEEIIDKYVNKIKPALIYPHATNEDHWCYWERCPEVLNNDDRSISKKDKDGRVDKQLTGNSMIVNGHLLGQSDNLCDMELLNIKEEVDLMSKEDADFFNETISEFLALNEQLNKTSEEDIAYFKKRMFEPLVFPVDL